MIFARRSWIGLLLLLAGGILAAARTTTAFSSSSSSSRWPFRSSSGRIRRRPTDAARTTTNDRHCARRVPSAVIRLQQARSSGGSGSKKTDDAERLYRQFLRSFAKGLSLPFPQLRRVISFKAIRGDKSHFTVGLSFREGLAALAVYLASGVLAYSFLLERWSIVDSLYFACVCFSTVGYGDLCPTTRASRIFTVFFGMGGIAFLGAAVAAVGGRFVEAEIKAVKSARNQSGRQLMHLFEGMPRVLSHFRKKSKDEQRKELLEKAKSSREEMKRKFRGPFRPRFEALSSPWQKKLRNAVMR